MVAASASAAPTNRVLFIGSGSVNRELSYTPVTVGGLTRVDITVRNDGKQNLSQSHLLVGLAPAHPIGSGLSIDSIDQIDSEAGDVCTVTATTIDCNYGSLTSRGAARDRTIAVFLSASLPGDQAFDAGLKVAENVQDVGSNANFALAGADNDPVLPPDDATDNAIEVGAGGCDDVSTYLRGSSPKSLDTCDLDDPNNENGQYSKVEFPGSLSAITLKEVGGECPLVDEACVGDAVIADIANDTTNDLITWTIKLDLVATNNADVKANQIVFHHYNDLGIETPVGGIANTKKNECKTASQSNCVIDVSILDGVLTGIFRTDGNGSGRMGS
jgi:hypothetical protein